MFKTLNEKCVPRRETEFSAYVDLFSSTDIVIGAGETQIVPLGVILDTDALWNNLGIFTKMFYLFQKNRFLSCHYLEIAIRSSKAVAGLIIANGSGKVDLDYPKEIGIIIHNPLKGDGFGNKNIVYFEPFEIKEGDKIAQCILIKHSGNLMGFTSSVKREDGFGSTGK